VFLSPPPPLPPPLSKVAVEAGGVAVDLGDEDVVEVGAVGQTAMTCPTLCRQ